MVKNIHIKDAGAKRAALIELEQTRKPPRFSSADDFFKYAKSEHSLEVEYSTYRGWFGEVPKPARPELIDIIALVADLDPSDHVITKGSVRDFRIAIGLDEPETLAIDEDDPLNPFDYLASIDMSVQQTGNQRGVRIGDPANLLFILEFFATRRIPDVDSSVALSAVHVRLTTKNAKATEPIREDAFAMSKAVRASIRAGGSRAKRFWEIDAADGTLVGTIDTVFTKLTGIEPGEEITATLSAFIKDVEPSRTEIRDEHGNPLEHSARDLVLARLQTEQLTRHEMGLIKLGQHTLRFRAAKTDKGR